VLKEKYFGGDTSISTYGIPKVFLSDANSAARFL